ncbi:MAG: glycosyltransferase [Fulvivirga sp.]|uniref:glycosyltransferase family 2 protein n=1 Tax=Fulvivirga sp. TaxID=1931237 RepID=UPI0032ECCE8F
MNEPLISIILPVYNGEKHIVHAIQSALEQSYTNIELIIVDNGSTDSSISKIKSFKDARVRFIEQPIKGVSNARNLGIEHSSGEYICFLDDDDILPENSINSRYEVFLKKSYVAFVNGATYQMDENLNNVLSKQIPRYRGHPTEELIKLSSGCFLNIGTLMIKRDSHKEYKFPVGWTHAEDLGFFYSISSDGILDFTEDLVYIYRRSHNSVMGNLDGLERGYINYFELVKSNSGNTTLINKLKGRIIRIMFLSYASRWRLRSAFLFLFKMILK